MRGSSFRFDAVLTMQNFLRSSTHPRSLRCGRITRTDRGGRLQTDSGKACADGAPDGRFHLATGHVEPGSRTAPVVSLLGSGSLGIYTHCECSFVRIMGLQAEDFCGVHADQSIPLGRLPAMLAGRLNIKFPMSTVTCWRRMHTCLDHAGKRAPFLQSSRGCSNASTLACESVEICALETTEKIGEDECDYAYAPDNAFDPPGNPILKKGLLPIDDLADMLCSAITDPDSVDIKQVRLQVSLRFRLTPSETFLSDLQQKLATLKMPLPISKSLLKKKSFLFTSPEHLQAMFKVLKDFFDSSEMAFSILTRNSSIIGKPLEHLQQMLNIIVEFQIEKQTVERCVFLKFDIDRTRDVLRFLKSWGVHAACRNKMLSRDSQFVRYPVEYVEPALSFLESIGMSKPEVLALLQDRPDILCRSVANSLMPKYTLCQKLGLNFSKAIRYTTYHSYGRILSQIEFFKEQGLSDGAIVELVEREPRVLGKSKEDLKLKFDFLLHTHNRHLSEIIKFPACLNYSFRGRILPRFTFLEKKALLDSLSLPYMLAMKSSQFRSVFKVPESVKLL